MAIAYIISNSEFMKTHQFFWGGVDVAPSYYRANPEPFTQKSDIHRDRQEFRLAQSCLEQKIPMIGICRGAQLLNIFNGGTLNQHIEGHTEPHFINTTDNKVLSVNSTHHQMMVPSKDAEILAVCVKPVRTWNNERESYVELPQTYEVLYYPKTKSLCIQFHPEWMNPKSGAVLWLQEKVKELLKIDNIIFNENTEYYGHV